MAAPAQKKQKTVPNSSAKELRLSKSKLMAGIQCPKRLYLSLFSPELAPPIGPSTEAIFNQGHEVEVAARKDFPGGKLIDVPHYKIDEAVALTNAAIKNGALTLYEGAFIHDQILVRVDILHRKSVESRWEIIEVKSTTSVKDQHIQDAAIQAWVLRGLGLQIEDVSILHLNNRFIFPDQGLLFTRVDITQKINETASLIPSLLKSLRTKLNEPNAPNVDIGAHCAEPYDCEYQTHCWRSRQIPEISVLDIPGLTSKRKWALYQQGILHLSDPRLLEEQFNTTQLRMIEHSNSGTRSTDIPGIRAEVKKWKYPLYFLDFETIAPALPRYKGTKPYQQLPFQFSCHIQLKPGGPLLHREYLHDQDTDPRPNLVEALVNTIGSEGSVVSYNKAFESTCINNLAETYRAHTDALLNIRDRLVDPLPIFRANVYDPAFRGSFSIKNVAPALLGNSMSYKGMEISDGTAAQIAYQRLITGEIDPNEKIQLKNAMLDYCRKDTLAMANLVEWLQNAIKGDGDQSAA